MFEINPLNFYISLQVILIFFLLWLGFEITKTKVLRNVIEVTSVLGREDVISRFMHKFEIRYIEQTTLRKHLPWVTSKICFAILGGLFMTCLILIYMKSKSIWLGLALGSVLVFCPLILLDSLRQYNDQRTRGELIHFLSLLSQWYMVTEDIIKSFERISEQSLSEPMATYINDFVIQVHSGLEITIALELLGQKIESDFFNTIVVNIDQAIQNRGDVGIMLNNLEDECYRLQEEFNRRKISTVHDKMVIYFTMILVLIVGYHFLVLNHVTEAFYFHTAFGQGLVLVFSILYVIGFFITLGLSRLEY